MWNKVPDKDYWTSALRDTVRPLLLFWYLKMFCEVEFRWLTWPLKNIYYLLSQYEYSIVCKRLSCWDHELFLPLSTFFFFQSCINSPWFLILSWQRFTSFNPLKPLKAGTILFTYLILNPVELQPKRAKAIIFCIWKRRVLLTYHALNLSQAAVSFHFGKMATTKTLQSTNTFYRSDQLLMALPTLE